MKVRCRNIVVLGTGEIQEHPRVHVGGVYLVCFVTIRPVSGPEVAIIDDLLDSHRSGCSQWPIEMFETVDDRIPSNWVCRYDHDRFLNFAPASWLVEGFFGQEYTTRQLTLEDARKFNADYERELEIIKRECG